MNILGIGVSPWIAIPLFYLLWVTGLIILKRILFSVIHTFSKKTKTQFDDILVDALDLPLMIIIFTSGGVLIECFLPLVLEMELTKYCLVGFKAATILAMILFVD